jgi:hypothetical protein
MKKKKNIKIIDNFLDKEVFKKLQDFLLGDICPWFYNDKKVYYGKNSYPIPPIKGYETQDQHQFTHTFLRDDHDMTWSTWTTHLAPLLDKISPRVWIRVKSNLSSINSKPLVGGWHCDMITDDIAWTDTTTSIFYINTNNGYTIFENGQKVSSAENRLAIFPNTFKHTGISQTDTKTRVTLNLNYLDKNENSFSFS